MKTAFLFPGQGAQFVGMGRDFYDNFSIAKETYEEADDLLNRHLSKICFEGPEQLLTETKNSQLAIFVTGMAIFRTLEGIEPSVCAGLSLGEYTALCQAGYLDFPTCLQLVKERANLMQKACEETKGSMAVVLGLDEKKVDELAIDDELWIANRNCPGQVVISGTLNGVERGKKQAVKLGAKRVIPLKVHGAFHSGLMRSAEDGLKPIIDATTFHQSDIPIVMNASGRVPNSLDEMKRLLAQQVTSPVLFEKSIREMHVDRYVEFGPGRTLSGLLKKIGVDGKVISLSHVDDLKEIG